MNFCATREERRRVQCRENVSIRQQIPFLYTPKRRGLGCRLRVNGDVISDLHELLAIWADHFVLKTGILDLVCKGGGKDPLKVDSF